MKMFRCYALYLLHNLINIRNSRLNFFLVILTKQNITYNIFGDRWARTSDMKS